MTPAPANERSARVVQGVVAHLARATTSGRRSLAVLGCGVPAQPPTHCLRTCLHNDPQRIAQDGCGWLQAAAQGRRDVSCLRDGRCPKGYSVSAETVVLHGEEALAVCLEGPIAAAMPSGPIDPDGTSGAADAAPSGLAQLDALARVVRQVGALLEENEGLADEVLRVYEQLNLIFQLTQKFAGLTNLVQIEKVLVQSLGELLAAETVSVVRPDGAGRHYDIADRAGRPRRIGDWRDPPLMSAVRQVRESRTVSVLPHRGVNLLAGSLVRREDAIDVVLVARPPAAREFTSGDLLLLEAVLAFGGPILGNTELHEQLRAMSVETTRALVAAIDKKDRYTSGHSERVGLLATLAGRELGLSGADLTLLEWTALLHDVGKIGVPEEILNKPGALTAEEFAIIKRHPDMGCEILAPIASFRQVLDAVRFHHENPDGTGYPLGLTRDEIPLFARIIHVVDVFDALSTARSYRKAYTVDGALQIIREEAGTKLDADAVAAFLRALEAFRRRRPERFARLYPSQQEVACGSP